VSEFSQILQTLKQPEYVHILLNPLPVYATAMGALALALALLMRSRPAQIVALTIIVVGTLSVWPVMEYGERGADRVYAMSVGDAQKWLHEHEERAEDTAWIFYGTAALAVAGIAAGWKWPKIATWLAVATLLAGVVCLAAGGWIAHAGGQVRHSEFRDGPPATPPHDSHSEH
jgi:hypothetical protein